MKIEAVVVCVDHADFLENTLPLLLRSVDRVVVVTSPKDRRTQDLVARTHARCVVTTSMYDCGRAFGLGAAINYGVALSTQDDWVLVIDADIVLCGRYPLKSLDLDETKLYGIDRFQCFGWDRWQAMLAQNRPLPNVAVPFIRDLPIGYRIAMPGCGGYMPCGFFQLWHPIASGVWDYPIHDAGTSEGSDMLHAARWIRGRRELIPEIFAVELTTSDPDAIGPNWAGRTTPEFSAMGGPYQR